MKPVSLASAELLPEGWSLLPLHSVARPRKRPNTGMRESNLLSLSYGQIIPKDINNLDGLLPESFDTYQIVEPGNIVCRFTDLQNDQRSLRTGLVQERGIITSAYTTIQPTIDSRWMHYFLRAYDQNKLFYGLGGGLRQGLKFDDIKHLPVVVPPREQQGEIAEFLDRETAQIDAMIDAQQRLVHLLEERQAVVQWQTILGQPNHPDQFDSWFGAPPSHWVIDKLGRHARVLNGSTPSRENLDYWSSNGDGHLWLNSSYANADRVFAGDQYVTDVAMQECHLPWLLPGTVLIAITGQGKTRGSVALLETESTINQHLAAIDANRQVWDPRYLTIMLRAAYDELRFISDEAGATKGALTCADLHDFVVPRPPLTEQQDLARAADIATANTSELVERAQDSIGLLRERRAAVITAAVTGRLDPRTGVERVEEIMEGAPL